MTPTVGLVLHFRSDALTLRCLRSLHAEGIAQVVLVDNSEDGGRSLARMREGLAELRREGLDIWIESKGRNLGFAAGVEFGLDRIRREDRAHVLLINSDAILGQGSLSAMVKSLQSAACVAPRISNGGELPHPPIAFYDPVWALIHHTPHKRCISYPSGCCLLFRSELLNRPIFDTSFFFYGDDIKLARDFELRGIEVSVCNTALVQHATSSSSRNGSLFYEYHLVRSHWQLALSLAQSRRKACLYLIARCLSLPTRALLRSMRSRSTLPWQGLWMGTWDALGGRWQSLTPPAQH